MELDTHTLCCREYQGLFTHTEFDSPISRHILAKNNKLNFIRYQTVVVPRDLLQ